MSFLDNSGLAYYDGKLKDYIADELDSVKPGFTGTKDEVDAAIAAGEIEPGTIIYITDDAGEGGGGAIIDDDDVATDKVWSSSKINETLSDYPVVKDAEGNIDIGEEGKVLTSNGDGTYYWGEGGGSKLPDGATVLPINDVTIWQDCLDGVHGYNNISQILSDNVLLSRLMADENAMKYLVRSTGFASNICTNQNAMIYLGNSESLDAILSKSEWITAITNSSYMNKVLNDLIPSMTSDTTPKGKITYSSCGALEPGGSAYKTWGGFEYSGTTYGWLPTGNDKFGSAYMMYTFESDVKIPYIWVKYVTGNASGDTRTAEMSVWGIKADGTAVKLFNTGNIPISYYTNSSYNKYINASSKRFRSIKFVIEHTSESGGDVHIHSGFGYKAKVYGVE